MNRLAYFRDDLVNRQPGVRETDLCIYGGGAAGVIAAVQGVRLGRRDVVPAPADHLGGQDVAYAPLRERLLADGQVLEWKPAAKR